MQCSCHELFWAVIIMIMFGNLYFVALLLFCCINVFYLAFSFTCAYATTEEATVHCNELLGPLRHRLRWWLSATSWWQCSDPSSTFLCHTSFYCLLYQFNPWLFWTGPFINTSEQWFSRGEGYCCQGIFPNIDVWFVACYHVLMVSCFCV